MNPFPPGLHSLVGEIDTHTHTHTHTHTQRGSSISNSSVSPHPFMKETAKLIELPSEVMFSSSLPAPPTCWLVRLTPLDWRLSTKHPSNLQTLHFQCFNVLPPSLKWCYFHLKNFLTPYILLKTLNLAFKPCSFPLQIIFCHYLWLPLLYTQAQPPLSLFLITSLAGMSHCQPLNI